jgi:hypothetical protein
MDVCTYIWVPFVIKYCSRYSWVFNCVRKSLLQAGPINTRFDNSRQVDGFPTQKPFFLFPFLQFALCTCPLYLAWRLKMYVTYNSFFLPKSRTFSIIITCLSKSVSARCVPSIWQHPVIDYDLKNRSRTIFSKTIFWLWQKFGWGEIEFLGWLEKHLITSVKLCQKTKCSFLGKKVDKTLNLGSVFSVDHLLSIFLSIRFLSL